MRLSKIRLDECQLVSEFILGIVAVARALLRIACQTVADPFVGYAPVADYPDADRVMLNWAFMPPRQHMPDQTLRAAFAYSGFGFIADPSAQLEMLKHLLSVRTVNYFKAR